MSPLHFIASIFLVLLHVMAAALGGALAVIVGFYVLLLLLMCAFTGSRFPFRQADWIIASGAIGALLFFWGVVG